jgi:thiamine-phosphate diphosphorylase/hydroxyethylthiazole kinase
VIKGNESEIKTVFGSGGDDVEGQRGVDSSSTLSREERARMVRALAAREEAVVVMTGKTDLVSDGARTVAIDNGHEYLGAITGTGCTLGTTISAMVAASSSPSSSSSGGGDRLAAVVAGILLFEIAAEQAAGKSSVEGPGTFVPAFLDSLYRIRTGTAGGDVGWLAAEKLSWV